MSAVHSKHIEMEATAIDYIILASTLGVGVCMADTHHNYSVVLNRDFSLCKL